MAQITSTIEQLEGRRLLSGNVSASVFEGNLTILGDDAANDIIVEQGDLPAGQLRISSGEDATTINGLAGPVLFEGITGDLFANLGQDADKFSLLNATLPGHLTVRTGLGADTVTLFGVSVAGNTDIRTGVRADTVDIDDSIFTGTTIINTRWGQDILRIEQNGDLDGVRSFFHGDVELLLKRGDDDLRIGLDDNAGNLVVFYGNVLLNGGMNYNDELTSGDGNWFDFPPTVVSMETSNLLVAAPL